MAVADDASAFAAKGRDSFWYSSNRFPVMISSAVKAASSRATYMALARISRNPIYESVLQTVYDHIRRYFDRFLPREEKILRENYNDLVEIIRAVEERQASKAVHLVQEHVCRFNKLMEQKRRKETGAKEKKPSKKV